jgi:hypothetical protein
MKGHQMAKTKQKMGMVTVRGLGGYLAHLGVSPGEFFDGGSTVSRSTAYAIIAKKSCTARTKGNLCKALGLDMATVNRLVAGLPVEVRA